MSILTSTFVTIGTGLGLLVSSSAGLTSAGEAAARSSIKDPRDGNVYPIVTIGGLTWFAKNLNHETPETFCYQDKPGNCEQYGRLYRWEFTTTKTINLEKEQS